RTTVAVVIEPKNTTVFRYQNRPVSYGHFELYFYSILEAQKLASFFVEKQSECPFECVNDLKCYSCNIAVYPVSKGHLCELLTTDKYRAKAKFHANASFHHYSLLKQKEIMFIIELMEINIISRTNCFALESLSATPCRQKPCGDNGDCFPDFRLNTYSCKCHPGFAGIYCERRGNK
ncbi:unnamed protein product, partial [Porites lobata]